MALSAFLSKLSNMSTDQLPPVSLKTFRKNFVSVAQLLFGMSTNT